MSALQSLRQWLATSTIAHVGFGFFAMGAWAVFANRDHALPQMLLAGLVQGAISGSLTLVLKKSLERMSTMFFRARQSDEGQGRQIAALFVPPLITASAILAILVTAHTLAGTPEILATIAVPFTVSTSYAIIYNLGLWRRAHGR
jgi:hypothetical protein